MADQPKPPKSKLLERRPQPSQREPRPGDPMAPLKLMVFAFLLLLAAVYLILDRPIRQHAASRLPTPTLTVTVYPTEIPSPTLTPSPTSRIQPTNTFTAFGIASPTPTRFYTPTVTATYQPLPTFSTSAGAYHLKEWTQADMLDLLAEAQNVTLSSAYDASDRHFYEAALLAEAYTRFPNLQADPQLKARLISLKSEDNRFPYALVHDRSTEPYRQWIVDGLNLEREGIDELPHWGQAKEALLNGFLTSTTHLFEQEVEAQVFRASPSPGLLGLFVVRSESAGRYSVFAIDPQWQDFTGSPGQTLSPVTPKVQVQIVDLNGNGRSEIAVTLDAAGQVIYSSCRKIFHLYEWDGSAFRDLLADEIDISPSSSLDRCLDITFSPSASGTSTITAGIERDIGCPSQPYTQKDIYRWDGSAFRLQKPRILLPPNGLAPGRCTIAWAVQAGPVSDLAVRMLAGALQNWPPAAEEQWGPASRDYFTLKLAAWRLQRGEVDDALDLLEQVRSAPSTPNYSLPMRIADNFLRAYAANSISAAQQAVQQTYSRALQEIPLVDNQFTTDALLKSWGFVEPSWGIDSKYDFGSDFAAVDALDLAIQQARPTSLEEFASVLFQNDISYQNLLQDDLDGDGRLDFFFVTYNAYEKALVAVLRPVGRFSVVRVARFAREEHDDETDFRWQVFQPSPGGPPVIVLQDGLRLVAFHIQPGEPPRAVVDLLHPADHCPDCSDQPADWQVTSSGGQQFLTVQYTIGEGLYAWDTASNRLIPTRLAPENQEANVAQAERALFLDGDPTGTIAQLESLLLQGPTETMPGREPPSPPRLRPYLLYLRALACDIAGLPGPATQAYQQLWQEYPENPFALAAYHKISP